MPQPPSWTFADSDPGMTSQTNEAMPRMGGRANPGEVVKISVDGETTTVVPTPSGTWEWTSDELADGSHEFEMWTEDQDGNESDRIEWENDVQADEQTRAWQRARNEQWRTQGAPEFLEANDRLAGTPPRPMTGGGGDGAGQPPPTDPAPAGPTNPGPGTPRPQTGSGAPASASEVGTAGSGAPSPVGLEKGNASQAG